MGTAVAFATILIIVTTYVLSVTTAPVCDPFPATPSQATDEAGSGVVAGARDGGGAGAVSGGGVENGVGSGAGAKIRLGGGVEEAELLTFDAGGFGGSGRAGAKKKSKGPPAHLAQRLANKSRKEMAAEPTMGGGDDGLELVYLGAGCFWCTEAVMQRVQGVKSATSGYMGGHVDNPTYKLVLPHQSYPFRDNSPSPLSLPQHLATPRKIKTQTTGHAECVRVAYSKSEVSLTELLEIFFRMHDPTTPNQQGADKGPQVWPPVPSRPIPAANDSLSLHNTKTPPKWPPRPPPASPQLPPPPSPPPPPPPPPSPTRPSPPLPQYRSCVFVKSEERAVALDEIAAQRENFTSPIVTQVVDATGHKFWPAEISHQDYFNSSPKAKCESRNTSPTTRSQVLIKILLSQTPTPARHHQIACS